MLDDAELQLTWEAADAAGGAAGALVKLLILSGARRNEITELARDEIGVDAIELPGGRTKNDSDNANDPPRVGRIAAHRQVYAQWH